MSKLSTVYGRLRRCWWSFGFVIDVSNCAQITIFWIKKGGLHSKTCRAIVNIFDEIFGSWMQLL